METLVAVSAQHKHHYHATRTRSQGLARFDSSPPTKFKEINCRAFHAVDDGILPGPVGASSTPISKQTPPLLKTPASPPHTEPGCSKPARRSSPIPISARSICSEEFSDEGFFDRSLSFSERWAGPTYSNSPPPSSLPIPKFLQLPKRANSLDFPKIVSSDNDSINPISKSAPNSPTRDFSLPRASNDFFRSSDSATKTLRRILNLEPSDE